MRVSSLQVIRENLIDSMIIFKKELKNIFSDRRSVISIFLWPFIAMPLILGIIAFVDKYKEESNKRTVFKIFLENRAERDNEVALLLKTRKNLEVVESAVPLDEIAKDPLKIGVVIEREPKDASKFRVILYYNMARERGTYGLQLLREELTRFNETLASKKLREKGLSSDDLKVINVRTEGVGSSDEGRARMARMLAMLLLYFLIIYLFSGVMAYGIDTVTGEKERGSLAVLLVNQVSRSSIALGKLLYVMIMGMLNGVLNIAGLIFGVYLSTKIYATNQLRFELELRTTDYAVLFVLVSVMALIVAAIVVLIAAIAKSVREAGSYVSTAYVVAILVGVSTMGVEGAKATPYYLAPLINLVYSIKDVFLGTLIPLNLSLTLCSNLVVVGALTWFTTKLFNSEKILEASTES